MAKEKVIPGRVYGRWVAIVWLGKEKGWQCECECGRATLNKQAADLLANRHPMCRLCEIATRKRKKKPPSRKRPHLVDINAAVEPLGIEKMATMTNGEVIRYARPVPHAVPYRPLPGRVCFMAGEKPMTQKQWIALRALIKELSIFQVVLTNMTENERRAQKVFKECKPHIQITVAADASKSRNWKQWNPRSVGTQNCRMAIIAWPMDEMVARSAHMSRTKKTRFFFLYPDGKRKFLRRLDDEHDIEQQRRDREGIG